MDPTFHGSSREEGSDSNPPCKRLKISNLLNSSVEDGPQELEQQWICDDASDSHAFNNFDMDDFIINDILETDVSTPGQLGGSPEDVCYGMLHNVVVHLKWLPKDSPGQAMLFGNVSLIHAALDHDPDLDVTYVRTEDRQPLGVLSVTTSRGLTQVKEQCSVRAQIWLQETSWVASAEALSRQNRKSKKIVRLQTDVLIFGDNCEGHSVAKALSASDLYLQDPYPGFCGSPYVNPQSLSFPSFAGDLFESMNTDLNSEQYVGRALDSKFPMYNQEFGEADLLQTLDSFFADLPAHDYLAGRPKDFRILTDLYSHQQTAVDFIRARELGCLPVERSLWKFCQPSDSESYYQHTITGAKSPSNPDALGGILADEMGLGKTLSILSAIVDSMEDARVFRNDGGRNNVMSTLIIVPSDLLLHTWTCEISRHIRPGIVNSLTYHGHGRGEYDAVIGRYHIVLTTYGTVMVEKKRHGALFSKNWYRIVLDEAHMIRNPSSKQFQAVTSLSSQFRWCITGTPIQNSLKDLESLVRFIRLPVFDKSSNFHKYITKDRLQRRFKNLKFENLQMLLGSISLRRNRTAVPGLEPTFDDRQPVFTQNERMQYKDFEVAHEKLQKLALKTNNNGVSGRVVIEAFLRLRMFCNNGLEEQTEHTRPGHPGSRADETLSILQQANEAICAYCTSPVDSASRLADAELDFLTVCLRLVCPTCMPNYRKAYEELGSGSCPLCNKKHSFQERNIESKTHSSARQNQLPSKIAMLIEDVYKHFLGHKCVIFSFWKRSLDIVSVALLQKGIQHLRVDGDVTARKRKRILQDFQIRSDFKVLLMTFSTGAVGLNGLTVADRIHILEPQWNPTVEAQAIGRVVRLGQEEKVTVIRYAMAQSIEETVRLKQHFKDKISKGGFVTEEGLEHVEAPPEGELTDFSIPDQ